HMPGLVRSPANTAVSPSISPAACSAMSPSRSLIRTWAPCAASSSAVARPMPRAEPVTIADLPSSTPIVSRSPSIGRGSRSYICLAGWPVACARVPPFRAPAPATAAAPRAGSGSRGRGTALGLDEDQLSVGQAIDLTDRPSLAGGGLMGRGGGGGLLGARGLLLALVGLGAEREARDQERHREHEPEVEHVDEAVERVADVGVELPVASESDAAHVACSPTAAATRWWGGACGSREATARSSEARSSVYTRVRTNVSVNAPVPTRIPTTVAANATCRSPASWV